MSKQNLPIPIYHNNKEIKVIDKKDEYEEEYKPNPDYDKEKLDESKK